MKRVPTPRGTRHLPDEGEVNVRLELSFDGSAFSGYQSQPHANTVQDSLRAMWRTYSGGEDPTLFGCSRLDAGVHANHFVLNFFTAKAITPLDCEGVLRALNGILHSKMGLPVSVRSVSLAEPGYNARFDAHGKHYRYLVWYGFARNALLTPRSWLVRSRRPLESEGLGAALGLFRGTHDFAAFRATDCAAKNTVRTIDAIHVWKHPRFEELFVVDFFGEGFLKNMVRNVVGTSVDVATGRMDPGDVLGAFDHGLRGRTGQCAPAHALTLERVYYDAGEYQDHARGGVPFLLH